MIQTLVDRLHAKPAGKDRYKACCPAHEDSDPSLVVTLLPDNRILIHCFAGCSPVSIMEAVGMSMGDLFPDGGIRDHMYGGTPEVRKNVINKENQRESDELMLKIAANLRKEGHRLSAKDLRLEREAYMRLRT